MQPIDLSDLSKLPEVKMRQPGYYWAKHEFMDEEEVVQINSKGKIWRNSVTRVYEAKNFEWISNTPIQVEKMPVKLLHDHYYVIQTPAKASLVVRWDGNHGLFCSTKCLVGDGLIERYSEGCVKILSGPFSIEQLTKLNPVVQ